MKNLKRILFLFVFIAGMAVSYSSVAQTAQTAQSPLTNMFSVIINLTEYIGVNNQVDYNNPNAVLFIIVEGGKSNGLPGTCEGYATPGRKFYTDIVANGGEKVTVKLENSNSYMATQVFYAVHQWEVFEMIIPAINPGD